MASTSRQAKDIAHALVYEAVEAKVLPQVMHDLQSLDQAFKCDSLLAVDLDERSVSLEKRQAALRNALKQEVHALVLNALLALQRRSLLTELALMRSAALQEAQVVAGYREAVVQTAVPLTPTERERLIQQLQRRFGGTVAIEEKLDPALIGGLRITIGDWTIDDSITGKLERLTHALYV